MSVFTGNRCPNCGGVEETITDSHGHVLYIRDTCTCHGVGPYTPAALRQECFRKEAERKRMNEQYERWLTEIKEEKSG